jgi:hypothetical protein
MGVLASHVPSIEQLRPGLVEVIEESAGSKQFFRTSQFPHLGRQAQNSRRIGKILDSRTPLTHGITVSGGFATVQPGSKLSINAVEGYPLEDFSAEVCICWKLLRCSDADKIYRPSETRSPRPRRLPAAVVASRTSPRPRLSLR